MFQNSASDMLTFSSFVKSEASKKKINVLDAGARNYTKNLQI